MPYTSVQIGASRRQEVGGALTDPLTRTAHDDVEDRCPHRVRPARAGFGKVVTTTREHASNISLGSAVPARAYSLGTMARVPALPRVPGQISPPPLRALVRGLQQEQVLLLVSGSSADE